METEQQINIYVGLTTKDLKEQLNKEMVLNEISTALFKIGVMGFNVADLKGFWNGKQEQSLKISFIDTFKTDINLLNGIIAELTLKLQQESILIEKQSVQYEFI